MTHAQQLAIEFSNVLKSWLTEEEMKVVNTTNATDDYMDSSCASHDFCDANMAMDEAWKKLFAKEISLQNQRQIDLWNKAWRIAKSNKFYI